jgi:hypothetical protein
MQDITSEAKTFMFSNTMLGKYDKKKSLCTVVHVALSGKNKRMS